MPTPYAPVFFYTRLGLGISDEHWLRFRLSLFCAVTLPSIGRLCRDGVDWVVFIDSWMPHELQRELRWAVAAHPAAPWIRIEPIDFMVQMRERMSVITRSHEVLTLVRIDDDDALVSDFVERIPGGIGVTTWPRGREVLWGDGVHRAMHHPFHSMNTAATVIHADVPDQVRVSHDRQGRWCQERGLPVRVVEDQEDVYLYSRHQLADSGFSTERQRVLEDPCSEPLDGGILDRFGVSSEALQAWLRLADDYVGVREHTYWRGSFDPNREALVLLEQTEAIHRLIWDLNGNLLQD